MKKKFNGILIVIVFILLAMGALGVEPSQRDVVAMTILGEARGEGKAGMYAVACDISQRAINRNKTAKQICLQRKQFSCWNGGGKNIHALLNTSQAAYAKMLATNINNLQRSYTGNADHYCTLKTYNYWTRTSTPIKVIGNHKFFKLRK